MPAWVPRATADQYGDWLTSNALIGLPEGWRAELGDAIAWARQRATPMAAEARKQRLTALGMTMSPNRAPAEATMWLHEFSRLLSDIAGDVLCPAIDHLQMTLKFLPTVAEIRSLTDGEMDKRRATLARLEAIERFKESGQPAPSLPPPPKAPLMDRRGEAMTEEETDELNAILERLGACSRYRPDGSKYQVAPIPKRTDQRPAPSMPTRADYISWGVDPSVLDQIATDDSSENHAISVS